MKNDPESNLQEVHIMKNALYLPRKKRRRNEDFSFIKTHTTTIAE
jgi:hypothetical protein